MGGIFGSGQQASPQQIYIPPPPPAPAANPAVIATPEVAAAGAVNNRKTGLRPGFGGTDLTGGKAGGGGAAVPKIGGM